MTLRHRTPAVTSVVLYTTPHGLAVIADRYGRRYVVQLPSA